ncbi:sensor domain-containing diguanylate cyclase [Halopseudomonas oceani]|uniref:sensor domain-containing diguanylate cyclase n=1 Tax=Halopseudomonas oceani TaxID=1708783 RepID=UPI002AA6D23F|nr:sensor domain-containing diguanylate cyclase [Halopseudomonas oceani]
MIEAPIPAGEEQRLAALRSMKLLDTPPDPHIDALLRIAQRLFGVGSALVSLIDTDRQWFKARIGTTSLEGPRNISFCGHTILSEDILYVQDALVDERFVDNPAVTGHPHIRFYAGIALHAPDGSRIGSFCVHDPVPRELTGVEREALSDFRELFEALFVAHQLRMDAAWLQDALGQAERRALIDPLTQLWNRQALHAMLPALLSRAEREGLKVAFIYGDLDHFKRINDERGHAGGDQVLIQSGQRMAAAIRPHDLALRLGGEELAVLALVQSQGELDIIAERMRDCFCRHPFDLDDGPLNVTISLGTALAEAQDVVRGGQNLIERADAALYVAKREGRNRVERG